MVRQSVASLVAALFLCAVHVNASIFTYKPVTADSFKAGTSWTVSWYADEGEHAKDTPLAKSFGQTSVSIYSGSSTKQVLRQQLGTVDPSKTQQIRIEVDPKIGPNADDYFIRFESLNAKDSAGTPLLAFSGTFSLTGMTGTAASIASSAPAAAADDNKSSAATAAASATKSGVIKVVATSASSALANATGKAGNATGLATASKGAAATASLAAARPSLNASSSAAGATASKKPNTTSGAGAMFASSSQVWIGSAAVAAAAVAALA
ncbi:hypothetical protein ACM66B_003423 [Microbotryomycetes sp. NB124-2]